MINLLAVDDEPLILQGVTRIFEGEEVQVTTAGSVQDARAILGQRKFDIVLLDLNIGEDDGLTLLPTINVNDATGTIILSVMADFDERVRALDGGADDFICKPFHKAELRSRVFALARRLGLHSAKTKSSESLVCMNGDVYDRKQPLNLTATEYRLLELLIERQGLLTSKPQMMKTVWQNIKVTNKTLDTHINNLRQKIKSTEYEIKNSFGKGFTLMPKDELDIPS